MRRNEANYSITDAKKLTFCNVRLKADSDEMLTVDGKLFHSLMAR